MRVSVRDSDGVREYSASPGLSRIDMARKGACKISLSAPIVDTHCFWHPELRTPSQKMFWNIRAASSGVKNFPFLTLFNRSGTNRLSIGFSNLADDIEILCRMNQGGGVYELTASVTGDGGGFTMTVDRREIPWQDALSDYRESLAIPEQRFPAAAWDPAYCTWYAFHTGVSAELVEEEAKIAAELGFGTMIVDDGWSFDRVKRHSPELADTWYEDIGDWEVAAEKFPDFPSHLARIKAMGMNYVLWVAPLIIGTRSKVREQLIGSLDEKTTDGFNALLPFEGPGSRLVVEKFVSLARRLKIDGLKIDYLDFLPPDTSRPLGSDALRLAGEITKRLREASPDFLVEYRQFYATPSMLPNATQFRAGDTPFDFIDNFNRIGQMRVSLGDRIPIHADPACWHPDEKPENVARHMMCALAGVPMLSMRLAEMRPDHLRIVRNHMSLYNQFRDVYIHGRWKVEHELANTRAIRARHGDVAMDFINASGARADTDDSGARERIVFNLTGGPLGLPSGEAFDCLGERAAEGLIPARGMGRITR